MVNFNEKDVMIFVTTIPYGKTTMNIKVSRKIYIVEFDKSSNCTLVSVWRKSNSKKHYLKYEKGSDFTSVYVKNDSRLDKDFFVNITDIANAQTICNQYLYTLYF
jgi:hypothetical protein